MTLPTSMQQLHRGNRILLVCKFGHPEKNWFSLIKRHFHIPATGIVIVLLFIRIKVPIKHFAWYSKSNCWRNTSLYTSVRNPDIVWRFLTSKKSVSNSSKYNEKFIAHLILKVYSYVIPSSFIYNTSLWDRRHVARSGNIATFVSPPLEHDPWFCRQN